MKKVKIFSVIFLIFIFGAVSPDVNDDPEARGLAWVKKEAPVFIDALGQLRETLNTLTKGDETSIVNARLALANCRISYKRIAYLVEYYFPYEAAICNGPPVIDPEEDEVTVPAGMQVVESWLFEPDPSIYRSQCQAQADLMIKAMRGILPHIGSLQTTGAAFLQSLDLELIRIMTLYLAGFDAPRLKTGVAESYQSFHAIEIAALPFCHDPVQKKEMGDLFLKGEAFLNSNNRFNSFDRLDFLKRFALRVQESLRQMMNASKGPESVYTAIDSHAGNIFDAHALSKSAFPHADFGNEPAILKLGHELFSEKALSKNRQRSCASCHNPASYFMDGLKRNKALDGSGSLPRNTPSLLYSVYQYMQFWDGRVSSIEEQVAAVLKNESEMGVSESLIVDRLRKDKTYAEAFRKVWPADPEINLRHVTSALSAYVRSLTPFTSPFDEYLKGNDKALSSSQKNGFNLFMGKAGCGTCHFAPLFNGLLPPAYTNTEFEVTGMIANGNLERPVTDSDLGRYNVVPVPEYRGAFKTPTVRDAAVTAPYMHNGAFASLDTLIEFYNKGGGAGLGLDIPQQTLSPSPLHLTVQEKRDIVAFIESLTDRQSHP
ncbi:MAG TPA: cytochrome c peroxidase [Puia sp.]|nr:cytochrome c peroxidase [Puia sp.]